MSNVKQVIVIRKDLKMRRGKEIAQGSHASMMFLANAVMDGVKFGKMEITPAQTEWLLGNFAKICVRVDSEEALLEVHKQAKEDGLDSYLVQDAGLTEFDGEPTLTACAIGPDVSEKIDKITGHLELY